MISANSENDKHSDKIVSELDNVCSEHEDISAKTITADEDLVKRAKEHGTTAGKQYLVDSLKEVSDEEDFDESDWLKKPVKDIMREIDDRKEPAQDIDDTKQPETAPDETKKSDSGPEQDKPEKPPVEAVEAEGNPDTDIPKKPLDNDGQGETIPQDIPTDNHEDMPDGNNQPGPESAGDLEQKGDLGKNDQNPLMDNHAPGESMPPDKGNERERRE